MTKTSARMDAFATATDRSGAPEPIDFTNQPTGGLFGSNTFNLGVMKETLSLEAYTSLVDTLENGAKLNPSIADEVAEEMKKWAVSHGATHFTHVFYPMTGATAE